MSLSVGVRSRRAGSGHHGEEALVQLAVVVEDAGAHLFPGPGADRGVGVGVVALGEGLEAVPGGVEGVDGLAAGDAVAGGADIDGHLVHGHDVGGAQHPLPDRKSTRLNSSHHSISYAVFCLKKKKTKKSSIASKLMNHSQCSNVVAIKIN